jgi:hypothetical protein
MALDVQIPVQPIEGEVIQPSPTFYVATLCVGFLVAIAAAGFTLATHKGEALIFRLVQIALVLGMLIGVVYVARRRFWPGKMRLIIGKDRLQLVEDKDVVVGQVPYDNMGRLGTVNMGFSVEALAIDLGDRERTDTFWRVGRTTYDTFKKNPKVGYDILLPPGWAISAKLMQSKIRAAAAKK